MRMENWLNSGASKPLVTAHRGDSAKHRENTLAAIQSAIVSGAQIVEIDIRQSIDGEVIVLHDQTLERLWGYPSRADELTLLEIQSIGFAEYRIPTLAQALELFLGKETEIMIDMDTSTHALAALSVVTNSSLDLDQVIWCGALEAMELIRAHSSAARIWLPWNEMRPLDAALVTAINPEVVNSHYSYWNAQRVAAVHELGLKTSAWTIDDGPTMRWAKWIGIDSITTNNLDLLQRVLSGEEQRDPLDLDLAFELATSIGNWAILICTMMSPGTIKTKVNPADLVTEIDLFIEAHLREMIGANFPTHNVIGEEFGGEYQDLVPTWYIDPIDGTTNFANRTPWSSMSLCLAVGRTPMVATTIDPWRGKLFQAIKGRGALINGEPLELPAPLERENPLAGRVFLTELAGSQPWPGMNEFLAGLSESYCTMRIMGAGTLTLTAVSANYGVGALVDQFSPIDHLAAALIGHEVGCKVLNEDGEEDLFPLSGGMLIAQPHAAEALYKLWQPLKTLDRG